MKVYRQGRYRVPEQAIWPTLPWRVDVPTVGYNPHQVRRVMKVDGVSWAYCRFCNGWNPTEKLLTASHGHG